MTDDWVLIAGKAILVGGSLFAVCFGVSLSAFHRDEVGRVLLTSLVLFAVGVGIVFVIDQVCADGVFWKWLSKSP